MDLLRYLQGAGVIESRWGEEARGEGAEGFERDPRGANEQESRTVSFNVVSGSWYRLEV